MGRMSAAERQEREERAEAREWRRFFLYLSQLSRFREAWRFANGGPRDSQPGGLLYTHLDYFLHYFNPCDSATRAERQAYLELARRMDAAGDLALGVLRSVEERLATKS